MNALPEPTPEAAISMASAIIHAEEALSDDGRAEDRIAFQSAVAHPEVQTYLDELRPLALLPVKRREG